MPVKISKRLLEVVDKLPLKQGSRVLEIGCGPGVAAREIASRIGNGKVLAIDRSTKAIEQAVKGSKAQIENGQLEFLKADIENFALRPNEKPYDFAFAARVGALDGRHPEIEKSARAAIKKALKKNGKLFVF
ncbi:MAG: class I SAM-dependent methyltransferase [Flavitalea sp.]